MRTNTNYIFSTGNFEIEADNNYVMSKFGNHDYYFSFFSNESITAIVTISFGQPSKKDNKHSTYNLKTEMDRLKDLDFKKK